MTRRTLTMPRLGETMEEGTISAWLIAPGAAFKRGEALLEVETDKTVVEYPALADGVLEETLVEAGAVVSVGTPIATVTAAVWEDTVEAAPPAPAVPSATNPAADPASVALPKGLNPPIRATPLARRLARQAGVSLESLSGTGRRGRIEAGDIPRAATGETVLLVHGFAGDGAGWASLVAALTRGGHRVLAPDLPGHGKNRTPPQGLADLSRALAIEALGATGRLHLIGHSMGAWLAAVFAAQNPARVASLTLIAPGGLGREIESGFVHGMAAATTIGEMAHLLRLLGPKAASLSEAAKAEMASRLSGGGLIALANSLCGSAGQKIDTLTALTALPPSIPIRALFGVEDKIIPVQHLFNLPPRVAIHILPTGHMPQWDAASDVAQIVLDALAKTHVG